MMKKSDNSLLKQYYNDAVDIPKEILIPEKIAEIELLQEWLWAEKKKKTKFYCLNVV